MKTIYPLTVTTRPDAGAFSPGTGLKPLARRTRLARLMLAAAAVAFLLPGFAQAEIQVAIKVAPPAVRVERAPAPRSDMIWIPGYWDWQHHRHVWVEGRWERDRPGYRWERSQWVSHNGRWILVRGYWTKTHSSAHRPRSGHEVRNVRSVRDRDHDGVRNRRDRNPDDPRRR